MHRAEKTIVSIRTEYLARTAANWRGYERQFLIELVRGLDEASFAFTMAPNRAQLVRSDGARHLILLGAASALQPFLEKLQQDSGGVPWGPTSPQFSSVADQHLMNCGRLAVVQRLAAAEQYGLAEATFVSDNHLVLEMAFDDDDVEERKAGAWLSDLARQRFSAIETRMAAQKAEVAAKIDRYASVHDGWFLRYDPDEEVMAYHNDFAEIYSAGTAEADALPGSALLGGRSFADWNGSSISAYGRVLHHIACATRLKAKTQGLGLRNLLTVFARKDDIAAVWQQSGETAEWSEQIIAGLSLNADTAAICERDHELPLPYYVDFGRHFVLLPIFGGVMNASAGLTWHLRRTFRRDWDRAVGGREEVFRENLQELFAPPRYTIPDRGFRIRRKDGTELTDIDAVLLDNKTGRLGLVQLKWPDIHGRSLAERNSRRVNLLKANEWVSRVFEWIDGRSSGEISTALGLGPSGSAPPILLVLARHAALFSGETGYDLRAHWESWPRLVQRYRNNPETDILEVLARSRRGSKSRRRTTSIDVHELPGLTVEVRLS
ncbi:hypothetical protein [Mesorhizobium xinjiangense]|uniref:hypothetical protein n=1 Tax=Mesorhizobium xinjiangense TaxID=2678685 RepID=UPI0012EDFF69|nr:hypothetical protein [Mesorhizobium xinjiangense]